MSGTLPWTPPRTRSRCTSATCAASSAASCWRPYAEPATGWPVARFFSRLSLRARLMLLGVAGLTVGFAVGGIALVAALDVALLRTADADSLATGDAIARLVDGDELSNPLPVPGNDVRVQVVDAQGRVRAAS